MSSCNRVTKSEIRTGTKQDKLTRTSAKTKGVSCSCGQLCKNFGGLKLHQIKAKCQASENELTGPDKRCFVSLTDILTSSFLKFGDTVYCKTPSSTFVPISNYTKPISATQCFVETNDIVIDPISEHFNENISPCNSRDGGKGARLVRPFAKNFNLTIIGLASTLKIQSFYHKWQIFGPTKVGVIRPAGSAGPEQ